MQAGRKAIKEAQSEIALLGSFYLFCPFEYFIILQGRSFTCGFAWWF
jgi:hypothetical protein